MRACQNGLPVFRNVNSVSLNVRPVNRSDGSAQAAVPQLDRLVPPTRHYHVAVLWVELEGKDAQRMAHCRRVIAALHDLLELTRLLIIHTDLFEFAGGCEGGGILGVVHAVELLLGRPHLAQQLGRRRMPLLNLALRVDCDDNVSGLATGGKVRPPPHLHARQVLRATGVYWGRLLLASQAGVDLDDPIGKRRSNEVPFG
mmetsp:Transcript_35565/g.88432  ORF Transcript_35565/g.88432 Transcript_35565/m.88432 type:complete len:200 (-) Transcript_35565:313-912(-)